MPPGEASAFRAVFALPLEQHLRDRTDTGRFFRPPAVPVRLLVGIDRRTSLVRDGDLHIVQTGDLPTLNADEMRMVIPVPCLRMPPHLESPDVVSEIHPCRQLRLGELDEVAVDRGAIEAAVGQCLGHIGVGDRTRQGKEMLKHRHTGGGTTQPRLPNRGFDGVVRPRLTWDHPLSLHDGGGRKHVDDGRQEAGQIGRLAA